MVEVYARNILWHIDFRDSLSTSLYATFATLTYAEMSQKAFQKLPVETRLSAFVSLLLARLTRWIDSGKRDAMDDVEMQLTDTLNELEPTGHIVLYNEMMAGIKWEYEAVYGRLGTGDIQVMRNQALYEGMDECKRMATSDGKCHTFAVEYVNDPSSGKYGLCISWDCMA